MQKPKHNHVIHDNCEHFKSGILSKKVRCYDKYLCSCQLCKRWGMWWSLLLRSRKVESENLWLHYEGNDMLSNDKLRYFDFTTHHSRFTTTKSSVQCHFDFNDVAVFFCLYIAWNSLILNTDKKIHSPFHCFVLGKWMSRLFRIPRISTHITTFHSLFKRSDFY